MTNLEKVRAAIVKAVPEIVELGKGCLVDFEMDISAGTGIIMSEVYLETNNYYCYTHGHVLKLPKGKITKVLGRPITLADVLLALGNKAEKIESYMSGEIEYRNGSVVFDKSWNWNLAKNLDDQSPETITFLTSVLCK